jgi:curved DNA-binding protein CbpA
MKTLYELLGALPHDDAEALRAAFRRAVKGAHPDLRPGDPEAALRFREIMRANNILADPEERAAYDHLLELARVEEISVSRHSVAATIYKVASGVIALAGGSAVTVGGYLLFVHISAAAVDPLGRPDLMFRGWSGNASAGQERTLERTDLTAWIARREAANIAAGMVTSRTGPQIVEEPLTAIARQPLPSVESTVPETHASDSIHADSIHTGSLGPRREPTTTEARLFRARGVSAYRNGDVKTAIADLDRALQLDPKFLPAYIDRGIIFYRQQKFGRAFADLGRPKRSERVTHSRPPAPLTRRSRFDSTDAAPSVAWSPTRTAEQDPSRGEGLSSVMLR